MKRAVLYARVSSDDRGREGRNLAGQLEMGQKYAKKHGYTVVAELPEDDRGASGAEINLPQLNKVREMARAGKFDVLVVREIDRLSRNLAKQLVVEEELKRAGVQIEYVLGEYPDTPEGNFQKHIKAAVAEYEREKIKERIVRGKRRKVESGHVMVHGTPPYGYHLGESDGKQTLVVLLGGRNLEFLLPLAKHAGTTMQGRKAPTSCGGVPFGATNSPGGRPTSWREHSSRNRAVTCGSSAGRLASCNRRA